MAGANSPSVEARKQPRDAAAEPGKQAGAAGARKRGKKLCTEVGELPPDLQELARNALVKGATFEEAVEAVNERRRERITLRAVADYYRCDLELQKDRVRWQLEAAQELKKALVDPESAQATLAEAALLTGLLGLSRRAVVTGPQTYIRARDRRSDIQLKERAHGLQSEKFLIAKKVAEARLKAELLRQKKAARELDRLRKELEEEGKSGVAGAELVQRIQEIYGLLSEPKTT